jgi:putative transcriptional regulator
LINIPIKNNIQELRNSRGLNQEDLAEALGVTRTYLSKLENQKFSPGPGLMQRVCSFFCKELGEVFYTSDGGDKGV